MSGSGMHDADAKKRKEAARALGQARTPAKIAHAKKMAENRIGTKFTEAQRANLRAAQQARRAREREEKAKNANG